MRATHFLNNIIAYFLIKVKKTACATKKKYPTRPPITASA